MEALILLLVGALIFYLWRKQKNDPEGYDELQNKTAKAIENSVSFTNHNLKKIKKNIEKSSTLNYITNSTWLQEKINSLDETLYTFRNNGDLLITTNGIVEHCKYELIIDSNSLIITKNGISELYDITNLKDDLIQLYKISTKENITFINKTKIKDLFKKQVEIINDQIQKEIQYYKYNPTHEFGFLTSLQSWEYNNPGKSVFQYVDFLAKKHNIDYEKWQSYNPNYSKMDFGEFLYDKFENKIR